MLRTEDHCVGCPDGVPCLGVACPSRNVPVWYCDKCENECSRGELRILDGKQLCYDCFCEEAWDAADVPEEEVLLLSLSW